MTNLYFCRKDGGLDIQLISRSLYVIIQPGRLYWSFLFQLWEDIGNWRSALKKKACTYVHERYEWDAQNRRPANAEIAKKLLERGNFLKDSIDEEVSARPVNSRN